MHRNLRKLQISVFGNDLARTHRALLHQQTALATEASRGGRRPQRSCGFAGGRRQRPGVRPERIPRATLLCAASGSVIPEDRASPPPTACGARPTGSAGCAAASRRATKSSAPQLSRTATRHSSNLPSRLIARLIRCGGDRAVAGRDPDCRERQPAKARPGRRRAAASVVISGSCSATSTSTSASASAATSGASASPATCASS